MMLRRTGSIVAAESTPWYIITALLAIRLILDIQ